VCSSALDFRRHEGFIVIVIVVFQRRVAQQIVNFGEWLAPAPSMWRTLWVIRLRGTFVCAARSALRWLLLLQIAAVVLRRIVLLLAGFQSHRFSSTSSTLSFQLSPFPVPSEHSLVFFTLCLRHLARVRPIPLTPWR